jgi:hypothetical protein
MIPLWSAIVRSGAMVDVLVTSSEPFPTVCVTLDQEGRDLTTTPWLRLVLLWAAAAVALGCKSTHVKTPPHAPPDHAAVGLVEHHKLGSTIVAQGLVAVSEAKRGDLVWRVVKVGRVIQLCSPRGCVAPVAAPGKVLPTSDIRFVESDEPRLVSPRAGVWAVGGARLPVGGLAGWALGHLPLLYYCWMNGQQPTCEPGLIDGKYVPVLTALSTHLVQRGDELDDVAWFLGFGGSIVRCSRTNERAECQFASR